MEYWQRDIFLKEVEIAQEGSVISGIVNLVFVNLCSVDTISISSAINSCIFKDYVLPLYYSFQVPKILKTKLFPNTIPVARRPTIDTS